MALTLSGSVTGAAQTGFTSPTYTLTTDRAPENNGIQAIVTAHGGTQSGVLDHSVANPFTMMLARPKVIKTLGGINPITGVPSSVARNKSRLITRKGVIPYTDAPAYPAIIRTEFDIPAGADFTDPNNLRALVSAHFGYCYQDSAAIGDFLIDAILGS